MRELEAVLKAVADPSRTRILKLLEAGDLCVCQIQAVLALAPSTVSKHLAILKNAELVEDRREGRWSHYGLPKEFHNPYAGPVLALLRGRLDREERIQEDRRRLRQVQSVPLAELCSIQPEELFRATTKPSRRSPRRHARSRARV
jgi:DNA-binding transcriptional ArsR family regulator